MLVPTTQKFMINHLGFFYVLKYPHADPPKHPSSVVNPLLLLDYRCHAKVLLTRRLRACVRACMHACMHA
jgi:hypothetical protein